MAVVAAAATTTAAAMTDTPSPEMAERLAALRVPSKKRGQAAHASKIFVLGLSTSAMFGLVAAMGWPSASAQTTALPPTTGIPLVPIVSPVDMTVAAALPTVVPTTPAPVAIPVAVPVPAEAAPVVIPVPVPVPAEAVPVPIPVAVPVPQAPAQPTTAGRTNSNNQSDTTTKASG